MKRRSLFLLLPLALGAASLAVLVAPRSDLATVRGHATLSSVDDIGVAPAPPTLAAAPAHEPTVEGLLAGATDSQSVHAALVAALQRDPGATLAVLERFLRDADPRSDTTRLAVSALVAVGTPAVQDVLVRLLGARGADTPFVKIVVPTLGFLKAPSVGTEVAVRGLAADHAPEATRHAAHLTLGAMASRLDGPRATTLVSEYASRLTAARTSDERRRWLAVLGNAGTPEAAAAVVTLLDDQDPLVRSRAAGALRRVASPEADARLVDALDDKDPRVRASAAWALSYRSPTHETLRALSDKLAVESDANTAQALLDAIWSRRLADRDAVLATLRAAAERHGSEKVRERARAILDGKA